MRSQSIVRGVRGAWDDPAMATISARLQRYSRSIPWLFGLALLTCILGVGAQALAHSIAAGVWGYIGVAGYLAVIGPLPGLMLVSARRFVLRWLPLMLSGAVVIVVSVAAGRLGWSGWAATAFLASLTVACVAAGVVRRIPARLATWRAVKMLRRHRPAPDKRWSNDDWEWAYTRVGTPAAMRQAAICRALRAPAADRPPA